MSKGPSLVALLTCIAAPALAQPVHCPPGFVYSRDPYGNAICRDAAGGQDQLARPGPPLGYLPSRDAYGNRVDRGTDGGSYHSTPRR